MQRCKAMSQLLPMVFLLIFNSGCIALIKNEVNKKFPPVSIEKRQLGAIVDANLRATNITNPSFYAFLPENDVSAYIAHILANPLPLSEEMNKYLKSSPIFRATKCSMLNQEINLYTEFQMELTGTHSEFALDGIKISGSILVRLFPTLIGTLETDLPDAVVRLRPAISSLELCELDVSKSKYSKFWLFKHKTAFAQVVNLLMKMFRDNLNGRIAAINMPIPFGKIQVGRKPEENGNDGVEVNPPIISVLEPFIKSGTFLITPEGITVVGNLDSRIYTPGNEPSKPSASPLPTECVPEEAAQEKIDAEFAILKQAVDRLVASLHDSGTPTNMPLLAVKKDFLSSSFNRIFDGKAITLNVTRVIEEEIAPDDQKTLSLPDTINLHCNQLDFLNCNSEGMCLTFIDRLIANKKDEINRKLNEINDKLASVAGDIARACDRYCWNTFLGRICAGDVIAPTICSAARNARNILEAERFLQMKALETLDLYLNRTVPLKELAQKLDLGDEFTATCKMYEDIFNKPGCEALLEVWKAGCKFIEDELQNLNTIVGRRIGTCDWMYRGVGDKAMKANIWLHALNIDNNLERLNISANAEGTADIEGWFEPKFDPWFKMICGPSIADLEKINPNLKIIDGRINLTPTSVKFTAGVTNLGASLGIAEYNDSGKRRMGFYFDADPITITATTDNRAINKLLRDNALKLPCIWNAITWGVYEMAALLTLFGETSLQQNIDPDPTRIGWADDKVEFPIGWSRRPDGSLDVVKKIDANLSYSIGTKSFVATTSNITPPDQTQSIFKKTRPISIAYGLHSAFTYGSTDICGNLWRQTGRYITAPSPFLSFNLSNKKFGAIIGIATGSRLASAGLILGPKFSPFSNGLLSNLIVYIAPRIPSDFKKRAGQNFRLCFGIGWEIKRINLSGCSCKE